MKKLKILYINVSLTQIFVYKLYPLIQLKQLSTVVLQVLQGLVQGKQVLPLDKVLIGHTDKHVSEYKTVRADKGSQAIHVEAVVEQE